MTDARIKELGECADALEGLHQPTAARFVRELLKELASMTADRDSWEAAARLQGTSKSPCGHFARYAWSPDGVGKQIVCLMCVRNNAEDLDALCGMPAYEYVKRLRKALESIKFQSYEALTEDLPTEVKPATVESLGEIACKALADNPKKDQHEETHTDENGTAWTRPTAWAYMQVCKAREAGIRLAAGARKDANKLAANNARLREALEVSEESNLAIAQSHQFWVAHAERLRKAYDPLVEILRNNYDPDDPDEMDVGTLLFLLDEVLAQTPAASLEAIRAEEHPDTKRLDFIEKHHVEMHCFGGPDLYHEGIVHPFEWEVGKNPEFGWGPRMPSIREAIDGYEAIRARGTEKRLGSLAERSAAGRAAGCVGPGPDEHPTGCGCHLAIRARGDGGDGEVKV